MKRKKAKKHPKAPKHPMSAYLYFVADNRTKLKEQYPEKGFADIARLLGSKWRSMEPEHKRVSPWVGRVRGTAN